MLLESMLIIPAMMGHNKNEINELAY